jgi:hypothetical protein
VAQTGRPKVSGPPAIAMSPKGGVSAATASGVQATRSALDSHWAPLAGQIGTIVNDAKSVFGFFSTITGGVNAIITIGRFLGLIAPADDEVKDLSLKIDGIATALSWQITETARANDWDLMNTGIESIQQFSSWNLPIDPMATYITDTHTAVSNSESDVAFRRVFAESATDGDWLSYMPSLDPNPAPVQTSYYHWKDIISDRPPVTMGQVYDWRFGVPIMMRLIAARLAVIATIDPNYAIDHVWDTEINDHRTALITQYNLMRGAIRCSTKDFPYTWSGPNSWTPGGRVNGCNITCADIYTGAAATMQIAPQPKPTWSGGGWYDASCYTVDSQTIAYDESDLMWQVNRLESLPTFEAKSMINILYRFLHNAPDLTEEYGQFEPDQASTRLCVDIQGDSANITSVTPMDLEPCNGGDAQWWVYDRPTGLIFNPVNSTCLTVLYDLPESGVPLYAWPCSPLSGDPQQVTDLSQAFTYDPETKILSTANGMAVSSTMTAGSDIEINYDWGPHYDWLFGPIYTAEEWHADTAADPFP